jgi:FMN-dependent NADH-azoreductase
MAQLLHLDSSARLARSHSRQLTREFAEAWQQAHPEGNIIYRDLGSSPPPHVNADWVTAAYHPSSEPLAPPLQSALSISDELIDEFLAVDCYVVGAPMYNFSIPSSLKAYIDQIIRPGRTFAFDPTAENPYQPLVLNKTMVVVMTRGGSGFGPGERYADLNFQDPYLSTAFGFIGISDIRYVAVENDEAGGPSLAESIAAARTAVVQLAKA